MNIPHNYRPPYKIRLRLRWWQRASFSYRLKPLDVATLLVVGSIFALVYVIPHFVAQGQGCEAPK